jgi:hypothetical protein
MTLVAQETNTVAALEPRFARRENNVIERYEGTCIDVSILLYRNEDERRDRLTFTAGPRVRMKQDVEELLFRAYSLSRQVHLTFESGRDRSLCLQMVYGVISGIFKELDRAEATRVSGEERSECTQVKYLEQACARAESYFRRAAQRRAQMRYLGGMTSGRTSIAGMGALLSIGLASLPDLQQQAPMFLASLIAGGMGAVLSVLYGMTSGNLKLHTLFASAESGFGPMVAAGALRPLLGGLSGIVAYVLLQAGIVPIDQPDGAAGTNFVIALAIVAGFSERWARGILAGTEERLHGQSAAAPPVK